MNIKKIDWDNVLGYGMIVFYFIAALACLIVNFMHDMGKFIF